MHLSRLTVLTVLGTVLFLSSTTQSLHLDSPNDPHTDVVITREKRDLLGNLLPPLANQPGSAPSSSSSSSQPAAAAAAPAPVSASAPAPARAAPVITSPTSTGNSPDATTTGGNSAPLPSLIGQVLNPPLLGGSEGPATPSTSTTAPKTNPSGSGVTQGSTNGIDSSNDSGASTSNGGAPAVGAAGNQGPQSSSSSSGTNANGPQGGLSPGLIVLMVIIVVAVLSAVLFSCYRIRQSRRKRQSWDEDILKNHAGSVGYSEGGGYGMYVGSASKEKPDLWRKNLDLFHRE